MANSLNINSKISPFRKPSVLRICLSMNNWRATLLPVALIPRLASFPGSCAWAWERGYCQVYQTCMHDILRYTAIVNVPDSSTCYCNNFMM